MSKQKDKGKYVGVIYFHGIGQQRHYESVAALVEQLNDWVYSQHIKEEAYFEEPTLKGIASGEEVSRTHKAEQSDNTVLFLEARYGPKNNELGRWVDARFFEGYWAPETTGGASILGVTTWLAALLMRPIQLLLAPWVKYERIKRAALLTLVAKNKKKQDWDKLNAPVTHLISRYHSFQFARSFHKDGLRSGSFKQFIRFLKDKEKENLDQIIKLAKRWRRHVLLSELARLALLILVLVGLLSGIILLGMLIASGLQTIASNESFADYIPFIFSKDQLTPTLPNILTVLSLLLTLVGARRFLKEYVGDIKQFVSYNEILPSYEGRQKILNASINQIRHVLEDEDCQRVVLIGHSLGSAIAYESLLELRRYNRVRQTNNPLTGPVPLNKVHYLVTLGSPIDKINYFFGSESSRYLAYENVVDELRGDITEIPFSQTGRQPWIHWLNYWDAGDPISGPIESVIGKSVREQKVDNVQIASYLFPDPAASHSAYFLTSSVMEDLFNIIFRGAYSFADPPRLPNKRPNRQWVGPGEGSTLQRVLQAPLFVLPITMTWLLAEQLSGSTTYVKWFFIANVLLLFAGAMAQRVFKLHRDKVKTK